ncbi:hypothetical protein [Hydrocarboniclastica marina]|uniref:Citrate transporter n=1 Tax=Hydrocarboniclastica marina TaxID=2259620 RepID=A0A4V1D982_9ALTE|nr:hypothetical protein [Hydrocarboniclastica marina]MAL99061.1 hypothetical protein [Alteromonadaceae bacterium]QCF27780.1 hypothetical protein soil367_02435 [Hydrocarboniclastica marina]
MVATTVFTWPAVLLPVAVLLELLAVTGAGETFSYVSCGLFFSYFLLSPRGLEIYARLLGLVAVATLAGLAFNGRLDLSRLGHAAEAAAFYSSFLGSLGLMQSLVRRFELLRRVHDLLLGGRPLFLYPKYALTSLSIASILNFSVVNVLCGSLMETLDQRGIVGAERQQWLRSILIVTLRGFALVPLIAPTSVAIAIITREVPALSWSMLVPYTAVAALVFVLVGWALEARRFRQVSHQRVELNGLPPGSGILAVCVALLLVGMATVVLLTSLSVSKAAMLTVPCLTIGFLLLRERNPRALGRELQDNLVGLRNEMFIFACSAAIGSTLASIVPAYWVQAIADTGSGQLGFAIVGMLMIMGGAAVGIAPLVVLTFLAGVLGQIQQSGAPVLFSGVALAVGFSMAMMLSPFGPSVMVLARFGRLSRLTVAFGWNLRYTLVALPAICLLLVLAINFSTL